MEAEESSGNQSGSRSVGRNALLMGAGVGLSRITGLLREQVLAWLFGAGPAADAYLAAMRIPNFFRDLLAENISSSAIVPIYAGIREKDGKDEARRFAGGALAMFLSASSLIAAIGIILSPVLVALFTPGFSADLEKHLMTVRLTRILFPFLVLISVAAFLQGIQNAEGRFFIPAVSSAVLNLGLVIFGYLFAMTFDEPVVGMAVGTLCGGAAAVIFLLPGYSAALQGGAGLRPFWKMSAIRETIAMAGPLVIGVAAVQINILVNTVVASYAEPGSIAYLNYAYRVMHLPLGLVAVTLSTAALPALSRSYSSENMDGYRDTLATAMDHALRLSIPAAVGLIIMRRDIIDVLFHYGSFGMDDLSRTAAALAAYAAGVPAFSMNRVFAAGYYAKKDSGTPVRIGALGVAANIVLNVLALLMGAGFVGIAASSSAAGWLQSALYFSKTGGFSPGGPVAKFRGNGIRAAGGVILMIAIVEGVLHSPVDNRIVRTILEIALGGGAYYLLVLRRRR